ncbi:MAG: signal peptidase II [Elusimicrobiaceae bacterium]|nr:signal peptidase II [Elusimicrobiaceae bacterium]
MPKWTAVRKWMIAHRVWLVAAALLLLVDRATKVWALYDLAANGPVILGKYLWLNYVENTGMAFGLFQNGNALLIVVMFAVIGYIIYSWKEIANYGTWAEGGAILILTGALGNLYDRLTLGFVVDFIDLRVWPVFNGADSFITVGAVLLGISLLQKKPAAQEK